MAQVKAEWEIIPEFNELAEKLVEKYKQKFYGIETDIIRCYAITNKERSQKNNKFWELKPVPYPVRLDCPYSYYITVHLSDWEGMEKKHRLAMIAQILHSIPLDENGQMEDGKVIPFDLKDHSPMVRTFGADYLVRDDIPDLLDEEVEWID
ncbi:MAG: hypothetical protein HC888_00220 [Candidatus Competibacteraceae bacterium]|nr:hypothetical protein [Candidatus Competibacteraceae bacterium]